MAGDEYIDQTEYTTFLTQFGISEDDCNEAFQLISGVSFTFNTFARQYSRVLYKFSVGC